MLYNCVHSNSSLSILYKIIVYIRKRPKASYIYSDSHIVNIYTDTLANTQFSISSKLHNNVLWHILVLHYLCREVWSPLES